MYSEILKLYEEMIYLDISTEEKAKAMATLESEKVTAVSKKWKDKDGLLAA